MFPGVEIYLFGSRLNINEKGGDIDILILSDNKIDNRKLRQIRVNFYKKFGFVQGEMVENYYKRIDPPHCYLLYKKLG